MITPDDVLAKIVELRFREFYDNVRKESIVDIVHDYIVDNPDKDFMMALVQIETPNSSIVVSLFELVVFFDQMVSDTTIKLDSSTIYLKDISKILIKDY